MQRKTSIASGRKKKLLHHGMLHNWVRQETTEIHVPSSGFENAKKPTNIKKCNSRGKPDARCQNQGPKNELDEGTVRFVAAQLPTGSRDTSVACGPDSPRPKDCPGLGDPNTLESIFDQCLINSFSIWAKNDQKLVAEKQKKMDKNW